jgi:hypothetical protein
MTKVEAAVEWLTEMLGAGARGAGSHCRRAASDLTGDERPDHCPRTSDQIAPGPDE